MKKKCTNSACRRVFSVAAAGLLPTCPYCGKAYPRLAATHSVGVLLVGRNREISSKLAVKRYLRVTGCRLRLAHNVITHLDDRNVLWAVLPPQQAQAEAAGWEELGVFVRLVPAP